MLIFCSASGAFSFSTPAISFFRAGFFSSSDLASFVDILGSFFSVAGSASAAAAVVVVVASVAFDLPLLGFSVVGAGLAGLALGLLSPSLGAVAFPLGSLDSDMVVVGCWGGREVNGDGQLGVEGLEGWSVAQSKSCFAALTAFIPPHVIFFLRSTECKHIVVVVVHVVGMALFADNYV